MKCVKKDNVVKRVSDILAKQLVEKEGYTYCSKSAWKNKGGRLK